MPETFPNPPPDGPAGLRAWASWFLVMLAAWLLPPAAAPAAGVTVITHGFNSDAQGWVLGMAGVVPGHPGFRGTNVICYEVSVGTSFGVTARKVAGGRPTNDPSAEIVVKLDWGDLAGLFSQYDTYEVAAAVVPRLLQTNFIAELGGRALAELPLHLVGHSRGGSLVCQMSLLLGTNGVWVDQVTTLDPHPVNEDGNSDPLFVVDAPLRIYENVLFADNVWQDFGGYPHGQFIGDAFNRRLIALPGGYSSAHSDTHLWYHATIDATGGANDTEASLAAGDRATWYAAGENGGARAGFHYSRLAGGDRLGLETPAGPGTDAPVLGYNRLWNLGAGPGANRTLLPSNQGLWPNPILLRLAGTNAVVQGGSNAVTLHYQWARPATSNAAATVFLDPDTNPFNGNERIVGQWTVPGTTSNQMGVVMLGLNVAASNTVPGLHAIGLRLAAGGRSRYAYAPEALAVISSLEPPRLAIERVPGPGALIEVRGQAGQRVVVERAADLQAWQPIGTNWLETGPWWLVDPMQPAGARYYRGQVR